MKRSIWLAPVMLFATLATSMADERPESWDGLVEVKAKKMDAAYLAPGADFRPYTKVIIDPTQAAFNKDWMKRMNDPTRSVSTRITQEDADKIIASTQSNFDDIFREAFEKAGYPVVTAPGPDVVRVSTAVINLYVNAPDTMTPGRSRTFTTDAGEATLVMEVRDSMTRALLARVLDRRETRGTGQMQMASSVTNVNDFRMLFKQWASITIKGIGELRALSPVPTDLKPGQKLN